MGGFVTPWTGLSATGAADVARSTPAGTFVRLTSLTAPYAGAPPFTTVLEVANSGVTLEELFTAGGAARFRSGEATIALETRAIEVRATCAPVPRVLVAFATHWASGASASQDAGPIVHRSRPIDMLRNARTMSGSNWVPVQRINSILACCGVIACL